MFGVKALSDVLGIGIAALKGILKKYDLPCKRRGPYRFFENEDLISIYGTLRNYRPDLRESLDGLLTQFEARKGMD